MANVDGTLRSAWRRWRESRRQHQIDRALHNADRVKGGNDHPDIQPSQNSGNPLG